VALDSRTVIFLHIPKTGGTTFHKILERNYAPHETLTFDGSRHSTEIESFAKLPEAQRARYRLVKGHLEFGFHRFLGGESTYVTFLRDPIARAVSFYSHARSRSDHYLHRLVTDQRLRLENLLEQGATSELFNQQTQMISGCPSDPNCPLDHNALERAKQNLRSNFCFVGLTEEFDAGLVLLSRMLGWSRPFYVKRNVSFEKTRAESLPAQLRAVLRDANSLDFELFEFARTLLAAQIRAAGAGFASELRRFQRLNAVAGRGYESYQSIKRGVQGLIGRR
jgi:Sulfotransferase family